MSLPTASSQMGRVIAQFPNQPSMLPSAQAQQQGALRVPVEQPAQGGTQDSGTVSDFQWILAWAAMGLVLWLLARTTAGYKAIYWVLVILILTILLVQFQWFSGLLAPFASLAGKNTSQSNQAGYNPATSKSGPKSPPSSTASVTGAAVATANSAGTIATFG